jgi:uncharacterized protein YecT (DUF1311 family)
VKKSKFTESQIVAILKEGEAGVSIAEIARGARKVQNPRDQRAQRKTVMKWLVVPAAACLLGGAVLAQPAVPAGCENAASAAAMRECENARLKRAEDGMNAAYRSLEAKLDERGKEKLRAAQAAWRRFRAADADYHADAARDGTLAPVISASVQADLTEARRRELEKALNDTK